MIEKILFNLKIVIYTLVKKEKKKRIFFNFKNILKNFNFFYKYHLEKSLLY